MDIIAAVEAFNAVSEPKIVVRGTFRDVHFEATLPRVGRSINLGKGMTEAHKGSVQDLALLSEARRAAEPGLALLSAALNALHELVDQSPPPAG